MNVQTTDQELYRQLEAMTLERFTIGSELFGLNNADSDTDTLCVCAPSISQQSSFLWEHHNIQFASEAEDRIYTTLQNFVRNLLIGDSLYNFELIHDEQFKNSSLGFLYECRKDFYSYGIIRGYVGIARRDLKHSMKDGKRFSHAYRSIVAARMLLNENFYTNDFKTHCKDDYDIMVALKNNSYDGDKRQLLDSLKEEAEEMRKTLSDKLNFKKINRYMAVENMKKIDAWMMDYCSSDVYRNRQVENINLDLYYETLESGINY